MMLSITHHPFGNGHPYAISADQRNPGFRLRETRCGSER